MAFDESSYAMQPRPCRINERGEGWSKHRQTGCSHTQAHTQTQTYSQKIVTCTDNDNLSHNYTFITHM